MSAALTVRMDEAVLARLDALASERGIGRDAIVKMALEEHLASWGAGTAPLADWQLALIDEGIAAADRGEFATHEEVEAVFSKFRG